MAEQMPKVVPEHRLTVPEVLGMLVSDGMVEQTEADALIAEVRLKKSAAHPLCIVAEPEVEIRQAPFRPLTLEDLGEWFASRVGLEYFHIDPLKVDFTSVTDVVSSAYATRFGILAVQVSASEIVFATTEPFLRDWEKEIEFISKKRIRRVIANPLDVARYLVEFYNLARSVKKASQLGNQSAGLSSFEQLVELGRSNRQFDANDQHIVNIVDWLWQYAFDQRASDIHIEPRRELGIVRFRIDGVLHQVYQIPMSVMAAMVSRIKILGPHGPRGKAPPAGRAYQDAHCRRAGGRTAAVHAADRFRRKTGDAHLRPGSVGAQLHRPSAFPTRTASAGSPWPRVRTASSW